MIAALSGAIVLGGSAIGPTVAAGAPAGFSNGEISGALGHRCFTIGLDGPGQAIVAQRRSGVTLKTASFAAGGYTKVCLTPMRAGDRIRISVDGTVLRTAKVPAIGLEVDRPTDVVRIQLPDESAEGTLFLTNMVAGIRAGIGLAELFSVGPNGRHQTDTTGLFDILPGDTVGVEMRTGIDRWARFDATPTAAVRVGSASVVGSGPLGGTITVTLRTAGGTLRGTAVARRIGFTGELYQTTYSSTFRQSGSAVKVKAGDRVKHPGTSVAFTVPAPSLEVDVPGASLTMTCPANGSYIVRVNGQEVASDASGTGAIAVDELDVLEPLEPGTVIEARCDNRAGYGIIEQVVLD